MVSEQQVREGLALLRQKIKDKDSSAEKTGMAVLENAVALDQPALIIDAYLGLASYYHTFRLDYIKSYEYAVIAKTMIDQYGASPQQMVDALRQLSTAHFEFQRFYSAIDYCQQALDIIQLIAEPDTELMKQESSLLSKMGQFYMRLSMFHLAKNFIERGYELAKKIGDPTNIAYAKFTYANHFHYTKKYEQALPIYLELLNQSIDLLSAENQAVLHNYIAIMYVHTKRDDLAEPYLLNSLRIRQNGPQRYREIFSYFGLIQLYNRKGDRPKVSEMAVLIKAILNDFPQFFTEHMSNDVNAEVCFCLGEYKMAYEYKNKIDIPNVDTQTVESTIASIFDAERIKQEQTKGETAILQKLNHDMQQYAKQLEYSNTDLKTYAHTTSHDLREPLRMISTYMSILEGKLHDKLNDDEKKFMHFAVDGARRMDDMITRILDTAKTQYATLQPVSLPHIAERIAANLTKLLTERNAILTYDPLPTVMGDEIMWMQVIQNLVTNAVKYNNSEVPSVHISFVKNTDTLTISIADNGVGIAPENRLKVFEMYSRVENPSGQDGTGIGLSTVKRNIERMKGNISIQTNSPTGSIFVIEMPLI